MFFYKPKIKVTVCSFLIKALHMKVSNLTQLAVALGSGYWNHEIKNQFLKTKQAFFLLIIIATVL